MSIVSFLLSDTRMAVGLAVQGILLAIILTYIWKFRKTSRLFEQFQQQWSSAESSHKTLLVEARDRVSSISSTPSDPVALLSRRASLSSDARNHVVTMSKNGMEAGEIARTCGIPENAVNVVLGFARLKELRNA